MHPGRQDLNVIFFTFRSCRPLDGRQAPCRPLRRRQAPIFENFPIRHIFLKFCFFLNIKMKNPSSCGSGFDCGDTSGWAVSGLETGPVRYPFFLDRSNARRKQNRSLLGRLEGYRHQKARLRAGYRFPSYSKD